MLAPPPRNTLEFDLRNEIDGALSGSCCSSGESPLFAISKDEVNFVNCNSGLPSAEQEVLFKRSSDDLLADDDAPPEPSTYGEVTSLGECSFCIVIDEFACMHSTDSIYQSHGIWHMDIQTKDRANYSITWG